MNCKYNDLLSFLIEALKDYIEVSHIELILESEIDGLMEETNTKGDFEILDFHIMTETTACFILSASNDLRVIIHIHREDFSLSVDLG